MSFVCCVRVCVICVFVMKIVSMVVMFLRIYAYACLCVCVCVCVCAGVGPEESLDQNGAWFVCVEVHRVSAHLDLREWGSVAWMTAPTAALTVAWMP